MAAALPQPVGATRPATGNFLRNGLGSGLLKDGRMKKQRFTDWRRDRRLAGTRLLRC